MTEKINENKRIKSLDGLKAIMMIILFCWHTPTNPNAIFEKPIVDLGARACEILFITSGFLVGYNHYFKPIPITFKNILNYLIDKIAKVWPAHIIAFILIFIFLLKTNFITIDLSLIFKAILNIFLLQSWTSDPYSFNGVMWFISSLLFCYLLAPLMMSIYKRKFVEINVLFILLIFIRIILELNISIDYHTSPIIRSIEFYIGILMIPFYLKLKDSINNNSSHIVLIITIIELIITALYIYLAIKMEGIWIRGYFIIPACLLIFIYALNIGIISKFISSNIFMLFSKIQMEFYIFHQVIIRLLESILLLFIPSILIQSIILFFITIIISFIYDKYFKNKLTNLIKRNYV